MRVHLVRLFLLAASVCCTMVLLSIVHYSAVNKTPGISEEDGLSENLQRRVLTGRVAAVSPTRGQEYMFMKKMLFDRIEANESISKVRKSNITAINVVAREPNAREEPEKEVLLAKKGKSLSPMSDDNKQSETCHPRRANQRMENIFGPKFNSSLDPFCTLSSLQTIYAKTYPLPFGFKGVETQIRTLLQKLPEDGLPDSIKKNPCRRCMVVGNGGLLKGSGLGQRIDGFDVVIRLNNAPIESYEKDVGSKTTMRLIYPESSVLPAHEYIQPWMLLVVPFKSADLQWTDYVVDGRNVSTLHGFWSRIADFVPKAKQHIRIFNPAIISETSSQLIGFKLGTGKMNKNVPTTGVMAIMAALRMCDEVSVSGFGYDTTRPDAPVHYYSETDKMKSISTSWTHDIPPERKMLRSLVEQGVIQDETKGLR